MYSAKYSSIRRYVRPNQESTFGFFNTTKQCHNENSLELLGDVDMFWQPTQTFHSGTSFLVIRLLLVLTGEFLQMRVLEMANKEKGACEKIFKLFLYVQMMYWPLEVTFITATDWIHPLNEILGGEWVCDVFFFIKYSCWHIILFHSFIVALVRYMFLIHHRFVESQGKETIKKLFFWIILVVAFVTTSWKYFGSGELDTDPYLNKCRGKYHVAFLRFENALEGVKGFCDREYDLKDLSSYLTAMAKKISCIASSLVFVLMGLNISEGLLYSRLICHVRK